LINEINFLNVFFHVEPQYEDGFSLTITVFAVEGAQTLFTIPYETCIFLNIELL
jgi:hypothetical protein